MLAEKIVAAATKLFFEDGYGATSIEAVARAARISKRTFYHRFAGKAALFGAVVHGIVESLHPDAAVPLFEDGECEQVLGRLARLMVHAAVAPKVLALHRLIVAEATRFPELAAVAAGEGSRAQAIAGIAGVLWREAAAGGIAVTNFEFAAEQFMQLVVAVPQRRALGLGVPMRPEEREAWADDTVRLFLDGCRARQSAQ